MIHGVVTSIGAGGMPQSVYDSSEIDTRAISSQLPSRRAYSGLAFLGRPTTSSVDPQLLSSSFPRTISIPHLYCHSRSNLENVFFEFTQHAYKFGLF